MPSSSLLFSRLVERLAIDPWHRDGRDEAEDDQDADGEENLASQVRNAKGIDDGFDHDPMTSARPPAASIFSLAEAENLLRPHDQRRLQIAIAQYLQRSARMLDRAALPGAPPA